MTSIGILRAARGACGCVAMAMVAACQGGEHVLPLPPADASADAGERVDAGERADAGASADTSAGGSGELDAGGDTGGGASAALSDAESAAD